MLSAKMLGTEVLLRSLPDGSAWTGWRCSPRHLHRHRACRPGRLRGRQRISQRRGQRPAKGRQDPRSRHRLGGLGRGRHGRPRHGRLGRMRRGQYAPRRPAPFSMGAYRRNQMATIPMSPIGAARISGCWTNTAPRPATRFCPAPVIWNWPPRCWPPRARTAPSKSAI